MTQALQTHSSLMTAQAAIKFMQKTGKRVTLSPWGDVACYICHQDMIVRVSLTDMTTCAATVVDVLSVDEFLTRYDDLELKEYEFAAI